MICIGWEGSAIICQPPASLEGAEAQQDSASSRYKSAEQATKTLGQPVASLPTDPGLMISLRGPAPTDYKRYLSRTEKALSSPHPRLWISPRTDVVLPSCAGDPTHSWKSVVISLQPHLESCRSNGMVGQTTLDSYFRSSRTSEADPDRSIP
ncbi:hypothetical protein KEM48_008247 [Puccinia striiformis f. sp. tritici PST-130]|nr:hypothetical protein KEM48_008247 [Puccinia striiformis f. sp. tritici PST-130]